MSSELPEWIRTGGAQFVTTPWSDVLAAGDKTTPQAQAAVERLYRTYWYPVYAFLRREGHSPEDAQDATQELFARLLVKQTLSIAPGAGRFRSFLLVALRNYLINERERTQAQKRGGGQPLLPLDLILAEERFDLEPADEMTAVRIFERRWALALLDKVFERLRLECADAGRRSQFEHLKIFLTSEAAGETYQQLGDKLGLSVGGVKSAVSRLRARYRELVQEAVAETVVSPAEVEDELRHLYSVLSDRR